MTLIFILEGIVTLEPAFVMLPWSKIDFVLPKRLKKKFELPCSPIPGDILSIRYRGEVRGIIRSASGTFFKNSITIDLSTRVKNVSIKLSQGKLQMCGAASEEQGREGAQYLINHLLSIQEELNHMNSNKELATATRDWLVEKMKGKAVLRNVTKEVPQMETDPKTGESVEVMIRVFSHREKDSSINRITDLSGAPSERIAQFFHRQHKDFDYHSHLVAEIDWILTIDKVVTGNLSVVRVYKAMVNYNYNLGFIVNRFALYEKILGMNGFISSYDNCVEHCVKIKLPYDPEEEGAIRKKNKIPCHCFLVYKSGVVTQTGPGDLKMKNAYNLFWETILSLKDDISMGENPLLVEPVQRKITIIRRTPKEILV